jgi:hypothetical protein
MSMLHSFAGTQATHRTWGCPSPSMFAEVARSADLTGASLSIQELLDFHPVDFKAEFIGSHLAAMTYI